MSGNGKAKDSHSEVRQVAGRLGADTKSAGAMLHASHHRTTSKTVANIY